MSIPKSKQKKHLKKLHEAENGDHLWAQGSRAEDEGKIKLAIKLYRQAAKLGNSSAQSNLGNLLDDKIKPNRPKEAVYWYKRAIKSGNYLGASNLAVHYKNLGNRRWYIHWLKVAASMGDEECRAELRKLKSKKRPGRSKAGRQRVQRR